MIFFTEAIEEGMYNKLNLYGLNLSDIIYVDKFPYLLKGVALVYLECEVEEEIEIYISDSINQKKYLVAREKNGSCNIIVKEYPFEICILESCTIEIECRTKTSNEIKSYKILLGNAPSKRLDRIFPERGIVFDTIEDILKAIIRRATKEILIHDTYFDLGKLVNLFEDVNEGVKVRIITGPDYVKPLDDHGFIEIISSLRGHDRYICLDRDEVYVFGYSFKELVEKPRRVSYYTKIHRKEDIEGLFELFNSIWNDPE
jgi:hypothetical protein